nr:hypothetical protein PBJLOJBB_PBJLOJBB_00063 [synthetic construct]
MVSRAPFLTGCPAPLFVFARGVHAPFRPPRRGSPRPLGPSRDDGPGAPSWEAGPPAVGRRLLGLKAALRIPRSHPWVRRRPAVRATPANPRPTTHRHHHRHHRPPSPHTRSHSGHTLPSSAATLPASQPRGSSGRPPLTPTGGLGQGAGGEEDGGEEGNASAAHPVAVRGGGHATPSVHPAVHPTPFSFFRLPSHGTAPSTPHRAVRALQPSHPPTPPTLPPFASHPVRPAPWSFEDGRGATVVRGEPGGSSGPRTLRAHAPLAHHTPPHTAEVGRERAPPSATPPAPVPTPSHPHSTPFHPPLLPALSARSHTQHPRACSASSHGGHHGQQMVRSAAGRRAHVSSCRGQEYQRGFFVGQGVKKAR